MTQKNRIFDLDAGLLDDDLLAGQMRLLVGLVSTDRARSAGDRLPLSWQGHEDALTLRLNQLMGEMTLRGMAVPGEVKVTHEAIIWPPLEQEALKEEIRYVAERAAAGKKGRIRLPRNDHELWATYKYSLLARNRQAYESFGRRVATRAVPLESLWMAMVNASRVAPPEGGIRNALQHMWGYVSEHSRLSPQVDDLDALAGEVQRLAREHAVSYLINSTALGELRAWL
ncbi:YbgA family protein [Marinobacter fonticola]|uniref:hypothetical protein n=1 Tax=Marinobacter fonticola TaxID=2603215 RepID=UPI0011E884C8|nr:hypothetical protein [Marinobacter fonticola]